MHNHTYRETIHTQYAVINGIVSMSLDDVEIMCKYLIYNGTEYDKPKNTPHIRFRFEEPTLTSIVQPLLGNYGKCDDIEYAIINDMYPRIMNLRRRLGF
jgi:hypothetical protein